jgi:hypothetical protein
MRRGRERGATRSAERFQCRSVRRAVPHAALGLLVAALLLGAAAASAEPANEPVANPAPAASGTTGEASSRPVAQIVLVDPLASDEELVLLFRELLDRQGVRSEVLRAERFEPGALFAEQGEPESLRVFVSLRDSRQARLYFRGPGGDRYLLRKLALPTGLDAVGRELLGQVVESSVAALLRSSQGMTRAQASEEIEREAEPAEPPPASVAPAPRPTGADTSGGRELRLAARYVAEWPGAELGLAHGPGVLLGLRFRGRPSFGLELGAERFFQQSLETAELSATLQKSSFRASFELGVPLAPAHSAALALGPTLELTRLHPREAAPGVTLAEPTTDAAPALRFEVRYEYAVERVLIGAALLADVGLVRQHYDLAESGATLELSAPWLVRPGAALSIGVR